MTVCYAQLRLKGLSDYTNFSFTAQFISQDTGRKFETSKLKIHATGISVEASFQLQKNENAKNVSDIKAIGSPTRINGRSYFQIREKGLAAYRNENDEFIRFGFGSSLFAFERKTVL